MIAAVVVLRDKATLSVEGVEYTVPVVPVEWDISVTEWGDSGWISVYPLGRLGGLIYFVRMVADVDATQAAWLVASTGNGLGILKQFASSPSSSWTIPQLRAANNPAAQAVKQAWSDLRPRRITYDGSGNPTGTEILEDHAGSELVALRSTVAGFDLHTGAEAFQNVGSIPDDTPGPPENVGRPR